MNHDLEQQVLPRYTNFRLPADTPALGIQDVYQLLVQDEERNSMIFDDMLKALDQGRSPILLAERTAHVEYFEQRLKHFAKNVNRLFRFMTMWICKSRCSWPCIGRESRVIKPWATTG